MAIRRRSQERKLRQQAASESNSPQPVKPAEIPVGLTLAQVEAVRGEVFDSVAEGSRGVYEKHLRYFVSWCDGRGIPRDQIVTEHVQVYLREKRKDRRLSLSWLGCASAAIKKALEWEGRAGAVDWSEVFLQLEIYRRRDRQQPASVDGITREYFELIQAAAWIPDEGEWPEKTARRATFDIALISVMRDSLLRRSEAAAMRWADITVERTPGHIFGVLNIPFSKVDQEGKGAVGYLHLDSLARLQEMAAACGKDPSDKNQFVFGIGGTQVARRIKAACERAGLPGEFSGHSCRVGMAIDLAQGDTTLTELMQAGRWCIPATVIRYIRSIAVGQGAVARLRKRGDGAADSPAPRVVRSKEG